MIESIPHLSLGNFPTPVARLSNLERALGFKSLWIKRDDLSGPLGGGNKVRKLEYMFAAAHASPDGAEKKTLFTIGPTGSNHVRATAVYGKASGFRVECLLFKQPPTEYSEANYRKICENAYRVYEVKRMHTMFARYAYEQAKTVLGIGEERYFIPAGGSSPLGSVGYVKAVLELKSQIEADILPEPRFIFVPVGTCGTIAGLIVGVRLAGLRTQIVGVRVADAVVANSWAISRMVRRILRLIGAVDAHDINPRRIELWHNDFGKGYAIPTEAGTRAVAMMAEHEGITLENTYTGKTLAGMVHYIREQGCEGEHVLFWNTYGTT
ncbi:pyridoxal-phosphate dependent enzyme [Candidatus Poribacteria bacterium]|nr:pyridoxal-phosphate dependent enzyme [Candidatus Poribacteria bacterium]